MKKLLATTALVAGGLFLTGCGGNDTPAPAPAQDATQTTNQAASEPAAQSEGDDRPFAGQTITLGMWQGNDVEYPVMMQVLESFYEHTGITVEPRIWHDYQLQLTTELIGGTAPDIFYVEAFLFESLVTTGVLEPLDRFITPAFDVDDFFAATLNAFRWDGNIYGFPKDMSTLGLIYNIDVLAQAGFTPDDIPSTLEAFADFVQEVDNNLPSNYTAFVSSAELARHMFLLQAAGTTVEDANGFAQLTNPNQHGMIERLLEGFHAGIVSRPADLGHGWSGDSMGLGEVAFIIEGNWVLGHLWNNFPELNFGTREVPTVGGQNHSALFTVAYGMNAASSNQEAAWEFINFKAGYLGMREWTDGAGLLPTRYSVAASIGVDTDPIFAPFVAAGSYATPWAGSDTLPIISREYNNFIVAAIQGSMTLQEAMIAAEEAANLDISTQLR